MIVLACDPGVDGAFALWNGAALSARAMPTYLKPAGARQTERRFIDRAAVVALLAEWRLHGAELLAIEKIGGFEGQSVHGAFMFGHGAGGVTYAAEALGYRIEEIPPATWKTALKVPADKKLACARATALLPAWADLWAEVRGNGSLAARSGKAEAALIALYARQTLGPLHG
jgi:hypothetical protein